MGARESHCIDEGDSGNRYGGGAVAPYPHPHHHPRGYAHHHGVVGPPVVNPTMDFMETPGDGVRVDISYKVREPRLHWVTHYFVYDVTKSVEENAKIFDGAVAKRLYPAEPGGSPHALNGGIVVDLTLEKDYRPTPGVLAKFADRVAVVSGSGYAGKHAVVEFRVHGAFDHSVVHQEERTEFYRQIGRLIHNLARKPLRSAQREGQPMEVLQDIRRSMGLANERPIKMDSHEGSLILANFRAAGVPI
jgi:hypothetical protein